MCPCFTMHRSFQIFRASLKLFPTLDTIYEIDNDYECNEKEWVWDHWIQAKDDGWGQWTDIDIDIPRHRFK